jgi:tripartite-type tricarboxylate transporter receptor subunit TctC
MAAARGLLGLVGAAMLAIGHPAAEAQQYPVRPPRLIVGFAPGGATDIAARAIAQKLTEQLKQTVVVDNRPGAAGNLAAEQVARAAPDGYTILLVNATLALPSLFANLPFDATKDFAAISLLGAGPQALVVHPSLPVRSVKDMIALAQKRPGQLNYGSGGTGNISQLAMLLLISMTGVDMVHIPYKGAAPSIVATLSGEAQVVFGSVASTLAQIRQGRLRVIAVSSGRRSLALPDVPTVAEAGLPGYEASSWYGLMVPAATPAAIVERLSSETSKALAGGEVKERLVSQGIEPLPSGAAEFTKYFQSEMAKWAKVIKDAKIAAQ